MAAKKINYWEKRRELEDKARLQMENEMLKKLTSIYPEALKNIQEKLLSQADLHNVSISDLLSDYSNRNQEKYRKYIEKNYQELMDSDEKYNEFINEFFPAYDYAKVNRLLQIRSDIFKELAQQTIRNDANRIFNNGLEDIFNRCYTSNSNVFAQLGLTGPYGVTKGEMENYLNYPWSGKTFSNRLWGNISRLEQNLSQSIVNAVASGEGVEDALKRMRNNSVISDMFKLEADKFSRALENLVRTEYAHFSVAGLNKSLDDAGLKNKVAWSAEDERVCSICGERHSKLIKDDWFPPYHSRCRCTVMPKMDDLGKDIDHLYDEMFGSMLDEFAKDRFGVDLRPKTVKHSDKHGIIKMKFNAGVKDGMSDEQAKALEEILSKAPQSVRKLWNKIQSDLITISSDSKNSYYLQGEGVYFNYKNDSMNSKFGKGKADFTTFFHEFGHHIDSLFGYDSDSGRNYKSKELELSYSLRSEYNGLKKLYGVRTLSDLMVNMLNEANQNYPYGYNGVSDILSGLSNDKYNLGWHHTKKYWMARMAVDGLGKEAFAHMFAAYTMQGDAHGFMMKNFPESYNKVIDFIEKEGG